MKSVYFTDWKKVARDPEPTPPEDYSPSPIPLAIRTDGEYVDWISTGRFGSVVNVGKASTRPWQYPPRVNASWWHANENRSYWNTRPDLPNFPATDRIRAINDDTRTYEWNRQKVVRGQIRWKDCALLCSLLDLTPYQKLRVHYLYEQSRGKNVGKNGEFVIFMLAVLVCREDGRQFTRHPSSKSEDPVFDQVANLFGFSDKHIRRWIKKLPAQPWVKSFLGNRPKRSPPEPVLA